MKKIILIGVITGFISLLWLGRSMRFADFAVSHAQSSDSDYQKLLERDKNVPKEKVDKAFSEAKKIQDDILAIIAEKKPEFKLHRTSAIHLIYVTPGRRGETHNEMTWRTTKTQLSIQVHLGLKKEEQLPSFHRRLDSISMGEFFAVPNIGEEAILVKNVLFNTKTTSVGLHFVKGRAQVNTYITNHKRKTAKNEKELMEIVHLIEPLIIARPNFDD
jgi:hypothetical protein